MSQGMIAQTNPSVDVKRIVKLAQHALAKVPELDVSQCGMRSLTRALTYIQTSQYKANRPTTLSEAIQYGRLLVSHYLRPTLEQLLVEAAQELQPQPLEA